MKKFSCTSIILLSLAVFALSACGGGGGGGTGAAQPTSAVVKLSSSGTGTLITGINMTIELPASVSVKSTTTPTTDPGVVIPSGVAASGSFIDGVYTAATSSVSPATLTITLMNGTGFGDGEFCTVYGTLKAGYSPPTAADFKLQSFTAYDLHGGAITSPTTTVTYTVEVH
jgi:hypothetical protein